MMYRITGLPGVDGARFEVEDDATEDEIAAAATACVLEFLSFGWEPVNSTKENL